jgi:hypothetical protein
MKRAALFVAGFFALGACVNDFDALSSGTPSDPQSSSGGSGTVKVGPSACASKQCEPAISDKGGGQLVEANECCTYATTCTNSFSCSTQCSGGAECTGTCENTGTCDFQVTGSTGHFECTTADCSLTCEAGSSCTLDCTESASCDVSCDAKSTCVVKNCGDACDVTCGDGTNAQTCADRTRACGGCPS